jgi:cyclopropane fatty-acyl-phospholipid synthase-like methyltransferase
MTSMIRQPNSMPWMPKDNFYNQQYKEFGHSVKALGWGSANSQEKRFNALAQVGITGGDSVLDVGCGFGDLYFYLKKNGCDTEYTGLDSNKSFISLNHNTHPNLDFRYGNISSISDTYDWVVASGIFCFKSPEWFHDTLEVVQAMLSKSIKGVAFNCLFDEGVKRNSTNYQMHYLKRSDAGRLAGRLLHFSKRIKINAEYLPNDISFLVYK